MTERLEALPNASHPPSSPSSHLPPKEGGGIEAMENMVQELSYA